MRTWLPRFTSGLSAPFQGLSLLIQNPQWWRYAFWPILIQLSISLALLISFNTVAFTLAQQLVEGWSQAWLQGLLRVGIQIVAIVLSCALTGIIWVALTGILCPYFYGRLTKKVEAALGTPPEELGELSVREEVSEAIVVLVQLGFVQAMVFLISTFPVFGSLLGFILGWYLTAWKLGSEIFDYPLAVRGMKRKTKQHYRRLHLPEVLGLGTIVVAIAAVPILGSFLLVPCIVGAVILHSKTKRPLERISHL